MPIQAIYHVIKGCIITAFFSICFCGKSSAQNDTIRIKINVTDKDNPFIGVNYSLLNKRTGTGIFCDRYGVVVCDILKNDTLLIQAKDYYTLTLSLKDSVYKNFYLLNLILEKKPTILKPVDVKPDREFTQIEKDIKKLEKVDLSTYKDINALESPITAIYAAFSRIERDKRKASELIYEEKKRDLLKELLTKYIKGDIIELDERQFDDFINYCNPPDYFLKTSTQYELIMYFKYCYESYKTEKLK
jgi:hypothetical protein